MRAEIDRVLAEGAALDRARGAYGARAGVGAVRDLRGPALLPRLRLDQPVGGGPRGTAGDPPDGSAAPSAPATSTPTALLARARSRTSTARTEAERAELTMAARSVGKVWMLRHEIQGVPLPEDFAAAPPRGHGGHRGTRRLRRVLPGAFQDPQQQGGPGPEHRPTGAARRRCRPSAGARRRSGRTSPTGPAASARPRPAPRSPTWCAWSTTRPTTTRTPHAGPYVVLDISDFTFKQWYRLMMRHVHDYKAPVVLHPVAAQAVLPLPRRRRERPLPGRPRLRPEPGRQPAARLLRAVGPVAGSTRASRPSTACSGATPTSRYRANLAHFQHNIGV